ncbi:MAG: hypothetical protein FWC77_05930 [Defluviitaleaceae bacterium]|nr:hypothetical protein [Defluviitaleaceae bacterium]
MDNTSAMLWQLVQSLNTQTQDSRAAQAEEPPFEHTLMSLRPLLQPRQQKILDLMIKMQEVKALINEISLG